MSHSHKGGSQQSPLQAEAIFGDESGTEAGKKEISAFWPYLASKQCLPNTSGILYFHALNAAPVCLMKCTHKIANTRQFGY